MFPLHPAASELQGEFSAGYRMPLRRTRRIVENQENMSKQLQCFNSFGKFFFLLLLLFCYRGEIPCALCVANYPGSFVLNKLFLPNLSCCSTTSDFCVSTRRSVFLSHWSVFSLKQETHHLNYCTLFFKTVWVLEWYYQVPPSLSDSYCWVCNGNLKRTEAILSSISICEQYDAIPLSGSSVHIVGWMLLCPQLPCNILQLL